MITMESISLVNAAYSDFDRMLLNEIQSFEMDEIRRKARLYEILQAASLREVTAMWEAMNATGVSLDPLVEALGRKLG